MLEGGESCMVSGSLPSCEPEAQWTKQLSNKRPAQPEDSCSNDTGSKRQKPASPQTPDIAEQYGHRNAAGSYGSSAGGSRGAVGTFGGSAGGYGEGAGVDGSEAASDGYEDGSDGDETGSDGNDAGGDGNVNEAGGDGQVNEAAGDGNERYEANNLINPIGRDLSINCLLRLSRSDYGSVACLNNGFRSLIREGEIYRLRQQNEIAEHWVYFSCDLLEWDAYDPYRERWIPVPKMPGDFCLCSDKESLAVGTELLVFSMAHLVFRYSILTNSWERGVVMNSPRCLFGSASLGSKAIVAGGTDTTGAILSSAELYDSEANTWTPLPSMNRARKNCSGFFMDGKFYVIGGVANNPEGGSRNPAGNNTRVLNCGEEYDLQRGSWRIIENMSRGLNGVSGAPPLVAVVKNQLYAADYGEKEVKKYDKLRNEWTTLGKLPERSGSMNGWGLAFRACGERLIVIGGPTTAAGGTIELNSWIPGEGPPEWNLIARKPTGSFVYNCAVMGC